MEPTDAAEQIVEAGEEAEPEPGRENRDRERLRVFATLWIAVVAVLLAIAGIGGEDAAKKVFHSHIEASNTWAFYQAKNIRQTSLELAADAMEKDLVADRTLNAAARAFIEKKIAGYRAKAARYEDEPDEKDPSNPLKGEGKKQLMARARSHEKTMQEGEDQDPNFDYATALMQIAIVLASVAILAHSRPVLYGSLGLGALGTLLMANGYLLWFRLPF
jgi:hypothetical protein